MSGLSALWTSSRCSRRVPLMRRALERQLRAYGATRSAAKASVARCDGAELWQRLALRRRVLVEVELGCRRFTSWVSNWRRR